MLVRLDAPNSSKWRTRGLQDLDLGNCVMNPTASETASKRCRRRKSDNRRNVNGRVDPYRVALTSENASLRSYSRREPGIAQDTAKTAPLARWRVITSLFAPPLGASLRRANCR